MENMTSALSHKPAAGVKMPFGKAPSALPAAIPGAASALSFADMQIHYSSNVVQCHDFFTSQAGRSADELIDAIFRALNIDERESDILKKQHMNFNKINNVLPDRPEGTPPAAEATVYDFMQAQLAELSQLAQLAGLPQPELPENGDSTALMMTGTVLNGISRMLAHKLGDMSASDKIQQKIMERLADAQDTPAETALQQRITAFAQENPVFMYLHNEINAHDASVMLLKQTAALKEASEEDRAARERVFALMELQALTRIMALKNLQAQNKNVISARTSRLYFEDPIGLYSRTFINQSANNNGTWSESAQSVILRLRNTFLHLPAAAQAGKYTDNPTLAKARHHERKSYEDPDTGQRLRQDLQNRAIQGIRNCFHAMFISEPEKTEAECRALLDNIIQKLDSAPIMITRFASDLLARELAPQNADPRRQALKAGTPHSYITLDELINAQHKIRRFPAGQQPDLRTFTPANSVQTPDSFSYAALLPDGAEEAAARGVTYPIFRSNKNRMYAAKTQDAQPAIFGTLNLLRERRHNGLVQRGLLPGTYGNVVLVFRKNVLRNCVYTLGDRMRGYTSLAPFVCHAFAPYADRGNPEAQNAELASETLIPGGTDFGSVNDLVNRLLLLGLGQFGRIQGFEDLEVQIFDTVRLSREFISEVYFAGNVPDEQKQAIRNAVANTDAAEAAPGSPPPEDTVFYYYPLASERSARKLILDTLYDKDSTDSPRKHMSAEQLTELLQDENYREILAGKYGFHSRHQLVRRTNAENEQYQKILQWIERVRAYMASRPDHMNDEELTGFLADYIEGKFVLPERF